MEPRKAELKKSAARPKEEKKSRFQIVQLEERIAPDKGGVPGDGNGHVCHHRC